MNLQTLIPLVLKISVLLNVFAIGLRASPGDVTYLFRRPGELFRVLLAMNVIMPLVALALVFTLDLAPEVKIALVLLSVSPIPPLLPKKIVKSGGRDSYAMGLLIAVALLAIIFVPVAMEILERIFKLPMRMTAASIAVLVVKTIVLPIGLGVGLRRVAPALAERLAKPIALVAGIALLACVAAILVVAAPAIRSIAGTTALIALAVFVVVGLGVGHFLGGPVPENRTALAISTASRHPGIALAIAQVNFPQQKLAMAVVLLYLLVNALVSMPYLFLTKRKNAA